MTPTTLNVVLAASPILLVLILMVGFQWGGSKAGIAGWIVAIIIAVAQFGAGVDVILYAHVRAVILSFDVLYIIWAALLMYFVSEHSNGLKVIAAWFTNLTHDALLRVLLLGWIFTAFLQGVGGFGVPVAIVAPLLVGLGVAPLQAVVIASIGHAWAVTFGSLGSPLIAMAGVTGIDPIMVVTPSAVMLGVAAIVCGIMVAQVYAGWRETWRILPIIVLIGAVMSVVQYGMAMLGLWNIASAVCSLAGLGVGLWVSRWPRYRVAPPEHSPQDVANPAPHAPSFPLSIAGYMILVVLAVVITAIDPVSDFLGQIKIGVDVPEVRTVYDWVTPASDNLGIRPFNHTGAILLYSAIISYLLYAWRGHLNAGAVKKILSSTTRKAWPASLGILSIIALTSIMSSAGMTRMLAEWLSQAVPPALYGFVATGIGALGAFMTGNNTNTNAVFSALQMDTATLLGLSVATVLAAQTSAAGLLSFLAPAKIIVGASTVGMSGKEGVILRALLIYAAILLLIIAVMASVFINFMPIS